MLSTNFSSLETLGLPDYAEINFKMFLDQSRRLFFERQHSLISDLQTGDLRGRNRFRELLLGVKAVGKSEMLKVLKSYTKKMFPLIVVVYISYDATDSLLSSKICDNVCSQKDILKSDMRKILSTEDAFERIEALELLLDEKKIKVLLLVDEFHFVYAKPCEIGEKIVQEMSYIAGTSRGCIHCIVTGSSSCLRGLAFAKLDVADEKNFPSYARKIDLNSAKLQPKWIFPIVSADDFRKLLQIRGISHEDIAKRYICSGGRPGLAIEPPNIDDISYSLGAKHLLSDSSPQAIVLSCIFDCTESYNVDFGKCEDDLDRLNNDLKPICATVVRRRCQEKNITAPTFDQILYRLADDGVVAFYESNHTQVVSISCAYIYLQLQQTRSTQPKLTWKEAAALKIPTGFFHAIAEDVAFKFIKSKAAELFNVKLASLDESVFNFGIAKNYTTRSTFGMNSSFVDFSNRIHKELVVGKDKC